MSNILDTMARDLGKMLAVSPETGNQLGIYGVSQNGAVALGTQDESEFWILTTRLYESSEIEAKTLNAKNFELEEDEVKRLQKIIDTDSKYLGGALLLLKENGIECGSTVLIDAAERYSA